jgi:hypothetical protein
MSVSLSDLRNRLAYRLNENQPPDVASETARRDSFINEGYRKTIGEHYWWFLKTIGSDYTVNEQEIYTLPAGFRDMVELRQNRKVVTVIDESDALGTYNYPPLTYQYNSISPRFFVYGEQELHILPIPSDSPTSFTITITQTSGTATATSTAHGLQANDYVLISGADQSGYNGTFRVLTVPTADTFTFTVASATVSPSTGTISCMWKNLVYRYWSYYTPLTSTSDTILIPDQFSDVLVAYAYGRYGFVDDSKGNSEAGFAEYNQILNDMRREQNRREHWGKQTAPNLPETYD